jgi:hypothetical protein
MQRFFMVSAPSVHQMVMTLEKRGLIARRPGVARSLRVLVSAEGRARLENDVWVLEGSLPRVMPGGIPTVKISNSPERFSASHTGGSVPRG